MRAFVNIDLRSCLDIILLKCERFYGLISSWYDIHEDLSCFRLLFVVYGYDTYDKFALITSFLNSFNAWLRIILIIT